MARPSTVDPVEKFRFRLTVIAIDLSLEGLATTVGGLVRPLRGLSIITRAGFSELTLPKVTINAMDYRENLDAQRFSRMPGLAKYDPITLRRGVTKNRDLYDWYRLVNDEIALTSVAQELASNAKFTVVQSENFRKDVIIEVLDREGTPIKAWYMFNAWPSSYKGGDDLNSQSDQKLIEELSLTYEFFLELEGGAGGFAKEIAKGGLLVAASAVLDKLPFLR